ncbi:hypothetical protein CI610_00987 [invertebrate metagenome]|uniref:Amine oxidase domain-containing protein n=1 Tax=invertebrate metagenome TaxID=1711999 RepID=A0A2H9TA98_9ZZZZ
MQKKQRIAIIGSGISGLSCAWLLSKTHAVTLYEKEPYFGGHSNTVYVPHKTENIPVDTGFIVFNQKTYPNLVALFNYLQVPVEKTTMSFSVSINNGETEYGGSGINALFAQRSNLFRYSFWKMLLDIRRFYRSYPQWINTLPAETTLQDLLICHGYSSRFIYDHLLPMGAAIWSTPPDKMLHYPALSFLRFCDNHGLLTLGQRPQWLTVKGGSQEYVRRMLDSIHNNGHHQQCLQHRKVKKVSRSEQAITVTDENGQIHTYDQIVFACHADTTLTLLEDADTQESLLLSAFPFQRNTAVLHSDKELMPRKKQIWSSWNYLSDKKKQQQKLCVTYWMNQLQHIKKVPLFVTLNPIKQPQSELVHGAFHYSHPLFTIPAINAQKELWQYQGKRRTWYCGAWMGYGFHEDGLQSGLRVAELLGRVKRPWTVPNENSRIIHSSFPVRSPQV